MYAWIWASYKLAHGEVGGAAQTIQHIPVETRDTSRFEHGYSNIDFIRSARELQLLMAIELKY
jgi:hypothetical protein